jgi:hypothetical protein
VLRAAFKREGKLLQLTLDHRSSFVSTGPDSSRTSRSTPIARYPELGSIVLPSHVDGVVRACIVPKVVRCGELMRQVQDVEIQIAVVRANHGNTDLRGRLARAMLWIDLPICRSIIPAVAWVKLMLRVAVAFCCHRRHVGWEVNGAPHRFGCASSVWLMLGFRQAYPKRRDYLLVFAE